MASPARSALSEPMAAKIPRETRVDEEQAPLQPIGN